MQWLACSLSLFSERCFRITYKLVHSRFQNRKASLWSMFAAYRTETFHRSQGCYIPPRLNKVTSVYNIYSQDKRQEFTKGMESQMLCDASIGYSHQKLVQAALLVESQRCLRGTIPTKSHRRNSSEVANTQWLLNPNTYHWPSPIINSHSKPLLDSNEKCSINKWGSLSTLAFN